MPRLDRLSCEASGTAGVAYRPGSAIQALPESVKFTAVGSTHQGQLSLTVLETQQLKFCGREDFRVDLVSFQPVRSLLPPPAPAPNRSKLEGLAEEGERERVSLLMGGMIGRRELGTVWKPKLGGGEV